MKPEAKKPKKTTVTKKVIEKSDLVKVKKVVDTVYKNNPEITKKIDALYNKVEESDKLYKEAKKKHDQSIDLPANLKEPFKFGRLSATAQGKIMGKPLMTIPKIVKELSSILGNKQAQAVMQEAGISGYTKPVGTGYLKYDKGVLNIQRAFENEVDKLSDEQLIKAALDQNILFKQAVKIAGLKDVIATKNAGQYLEETNEQLDAFNRFMDCI